MKRAVVVEKIIDEKWDSKRQFAKHIGLPPTTLQSMLERGLGKASVDNVIKVCKGLGITIEELEELSNSKELEVNESNVVYNLNFNKPKEYRYLPTVKISAGLPLDVECVDEVETITIPDELLGKHAGSKDIFFMRVNGESMNKIIPHNSLIAVKNATVEELKSGDIVVYSNGYDYSVKLFYGTEDKFIFRPNSTDPIFTDYITDKTSEDLRLHGKVVTYIVNID